MVNTRVPLSEVLLVQLDTIIGMVLSVSVKCIFVLDDLSGNSYVIQPFLNESLINLEVKCDTIESAYMSTEARKKYR